MRLFLENKNENQTFAYQQLHYGTHFRSSSLLRYLYVALSDQNYHGRRDLQQNVCECTLQRRRATCVI